jgi:hypothetical protein
MDATSLAKSLFLAIPAEEVRPIRSLIFFRIKAARWPAIRSAWAWISADVGPGTIGREAGARTCPGSEDGLYVNPGGCLSVTKA